jgi:hypothetical protein
MCAGVFVIAMHIILLTALKTYTDAGVGYDVQLASWCQKSNNALFRDFKT